MDINLECIYCTIKRADTLYSQYEKDEDKKLEFMKKVFYIVSKIKAGGTSPSVNSEIMKIMNEELGLTDPYFNIKKEYNKLLLDMESEILNNIKNTDDEILTALKYAMIGNFIDFGAMDSVDKNKLKELIANAPKEEINEKEYNNFIEELNKAKNIVYLIDNSGEIVFDKVFIKIIKEKYSDLNIDVIVRGKPVHNDATMVDAVEIGLNELVSVTDNGTDIPGTQLDEISVESKKLIDNADFIISKGQGNFETLYGCKKNIYYIFLCKCDLFTRRFNLEKFSGVFVNEKNVENIME